MAFTYEDYENYKNRSVWGGLKYTEGEPIHQKADPIWFTLEMALGNFHGAPVCDKDSIFFNAQTRENYAQKVIMIGENFINSVYTGETIPSTELPKTKIVKLMESVRKIEHEYPHLVPQKDEMGK